MYRKIRAIEKVLLEYNISSAAFYEVIGERLIPKDSADFLTKSRDPKFSSAVDHFIWQILTGSEIDTEVIGYVETSNEKLENAEKAKRRIKDRLYWKIDSATKKLFINQKYFLISTYMPVTQEILTHLKLRQLPFIRHQSNEGGMEFGEPDIELRNFLASKIDGPFQSSCEEIVLKFLFKIFPQCFMEGAKAIEEASLESSLPQSPMLIFTANNFAFDEVFKYWLSVKSANGSVYVSAQHGNNYGTSKLVHPIESESADYFLTWGWSDSPKSVPAFNFKVSGTKLGHSTNGQVTIMQDMLPPPVYAWDTDFEYYRRFEVQLALVQELISTCEDNLFLRLHASSLTSPFNELAKWRERFPKLNIDMGNIAIRSIWKSSRLVVHTYDSTGILECLSLGIPCVALFQDGLTHLNQTAIDDYSELVKAKIIFLDHMELANHIYEIWSDIENWWDSEAVQEAINRFCGKYSRISQNPSSDLSQILENLTE
jgi:putative transferase (TIGR04331 family)